MHKDNLVPLRSEGEGMEELVKFHEQKQREQKALRKLLKKLDENLKNDKSQKQQ